jgi:hypothetical protein
VRRHAKVPFRRTGFSATLSSLLGAEGTGAPSGRRSSKLLVLAGAVVLVSLALGASLASGAAPTVTIENASDVEFLTATVKGEVDPADHGTSYHFEYATEADFSDAQFAGFGFLTEGSGPTPVEAELTGLRPSTTYHLRLLAENVEAETAQAVAAATFTTKAVAKPTVTIESNPAHTGTTAHFVGHVDPNAPEPEGSASPAEQEAFRTSWRFQCTPACPGLSGQLAADDVSHEVSADAAGLHPGRSYEVTLVAENAGGEETAGPVAFATPAIAPAVDATFVSAVAAAEATLVAQVNPGGAATAFHFEYLSDEQFQADGETFGEGAVSAPVPDQAIGSDDEDHEASATVAGLQPDTAYRYRLVATNTSPGNPVVGGPTRAFHTFAATPAAGIDSCPNSLLRTGPSAALPDCRAYEQASPTEKAGADIKGSYADVQASVSGDGITFFTHLGLPGLNQGAQAFPVYLATRGSGDWSTQGLLPSPALGEAAVIRGWTPDLAYALERTATPGLGTTGTYRLRANSDRSFATLAGPGLFGARVALAGASTDDSKIFLEAPSLLPVTSGPAPTSTADNLYLYDRDTGSLTLAGVLPDSACAGPPCVPASGSFAGPFDWWLGTSEETLARGGALNSSVGTAYYTQAEHAISSTGDRAYFTAAGAGQLYLRRGLTTDAPDTVQVNASHKTNGAGPGGSDASGPQPAAFMTATPDGSRAFFTSPEELTNTSNTGPGDEGNDLYAYDAGVGALTDLTPDPADPLGAQVQGVLGVSDSGDYVYFAANGDLDGAGPALPGDCQMIAGSPSLYTGSCSLYLSHGGANTFIATLDSSGRGELGDAMDWAPQPAAQNGFSRPTAARVSADGRTLVFRSQRQLTSYDNHVSSGECGVGLGPICPEYYRFHAGDSGLTCITCDPTGAPPVGAPQLFSISGGFTTGPVVQTRVTRNLSADGERFFFESPDRLAAADVNGEAGCPLSDQLGSPPALRCQDVYEWEAEGSGACDTPGGCQYLLSTGTSSDPSFFADASASGQDAFIFTRDPLVPQDRDELVDVYDARVDGGLASQHPASSPPCGSAEQCRGAGSGAPQSPGAGSAAFQGPANTSPRARRPARCPRGKRKVRRHGKSRCVAEHKRNANRNRRAGR